MQVGRVLLGSVRLPLFHVVFDKVWFLHEITPEIRWKQEVKNSLKLHWTSAKKALEVICVKSGGAVVVEAVPAP